MVEPWMVAENRGEPWGFSRVENMVLFSRVEKSFNKGHQLLGLRMRLKDPLLPRHHLQPARHVPL